MGIKIRKVKTASGKIAVQIVQYIYGKRKILEHIGSAKTKAGIEKLIKIGENKIQAGQTSLLQESKNIDQKIFEEQYEVIGHKHFLLYEVLCNIYTKLGFDKVDTGLIKDLSVVRIVSPTSKIEALNLLDKLFSKSYTRNQHKNFRFLQSKKKIAEKQALDFAVNSLNQNVSVLFYDVTTLYFESFKEDELRKIGFSKDNKFNQPQILVGLVMSEIGFPIGYHLFKGSKFEGHTMIPVLKKYVDLHKINELTVVADAAMISKDNITRLIEDGFDYIVGARLTNIKSSLINEINRKNKQIDQQTFEVNTALGRLIIQFSAKRYRKDERELKKAEKKARSILKQPSRLTSRYKFVKKTGKEKYELNMELIQKRQDLLGLKGYYTNTDRTCDEVISHYANLWKIEKNYRIYKNDLKVRPLYLWKADSIQSHLVLCFLSLCMSQYIEIKTGISIEKVVKNLIKVVDTQIRVKETQAIINTRSGETDELSSLVKNALKG